MRLDGDEILRIQRAEPALELRRAPLRAARQARSRALKDPPRASLIVDLNAGGGTLSCVSQFVSAIERIRSGRRAAKICAIAPPVSFATRGFPVQRQVDRDTSTVAGDLADDVPPQVRVRPDAET